MHNYGYDGLDCATPSNEEQAKKLRPAAQLIEEACMDDHPKGKYSNYHDDDTRTMFYQTIETSMKLFTVI